MAMQGILSNVRCTTDGITLAKNSVVMADALIAALNEQPECPEDSSPTSKP